MCGFGYGKVLMWSRLLQSSVVCGFGYCKVFADVVSAAAKSLLCVVSAAVKFLLCEASGCRKFLLLCVVPAATKFCSVWFRLLQSSAVCVCVCCVRGCGLLQSFSTKRGSNPTKNILLLWTGAKSPVGLYPQSHFVFDLT